MDAGVEDFLAVALGGVVGAVSRWVLSSFIQSRTGPFFPWGTLVVNLLGSLLLGFVASAAMLGYFPRWWRLFLATGLAGSLTTFSTFAYETITLLADYSPWAAAANIAANLTLGLLGVYAGTVAARILASVGRP